MAKRAKRKCKKAWCTTTPKGKKLSCFKSKSAAKASQKARRKAGKKTRVRKMCRG